MVVCGKSEKGKCLRSDARVTAETPGFVRAWRRNNWLVVGGCASGMGRNVNALRRYIDWKQDL
jgi:hypothetical protein